MTKAYLIDGSGYIFRAFYAVAPLTNKDGLPVNALFGFTKMMLKFLNDTKAENVAMVFDSGRETFRKELYPEYKSNRTQTPEELIKQIPYFRDVADVLGVPVFELPGFEADDVIATLAKRLEDDFEVVVISADKDLCQLVNEKTTIWDTMKDQKINSDGVVEKLGVRPELVADYLGLMGDASDNIPGIPGVGAKTAVELVKTYGDIEQIIASADLVENNPAIRGRVKIANSIRDNIEILRLSKKLATTVNDLKLNCDKDSYQKPQELFELLKVKEVDSQAWDLFVDKFNFTSLKKMKTIQKSVERNVEIILKKDFDNFLKELKGQSAFAFDTETDSLDVYSANLVGVSFAWDTKACYLPLGKEEQISHEEFRLKTTEIFNNNALKIGHNLKFDIQILKTNNIEVKGQLFDTFIASYLLSPDSGGAGLKNLAEELLGITPLQYEEVTGGKLFSEVDLELAAKYAGADAINTLDIYRIHSKKIVEEKLESVFYEIEMPLIPILVEIERMGIKLDLDFLSSYSKVLTDKLEILTKQIYENVGEEFNINSPKQLSDVLFNKLKINSNGIKKTTLGFSTDSTTLEKISDLHVVPKLLLEYRSYFKLKSTYVDTLPLQVDTQHRVHTSFNQAIAATGRLSSSNPNLQNIPIATELGRKVRQAFIPEKGKLLVSADYSQIELRVLADVSGDANLIYAFENDLDIHSQTARDILQIPALFEVTKEQRRIGKTINFGIVYGMGAPKLARELEISIPAASKYITEYFKFYSAVKAYFDLQSTQGINQGFVTTIFGRKRYLTAQMDQRDPGFLKRIAINAPIQGSAADLIKLAMIKVSQNIHNFDAKLLLQIHDELVFEVAENQIEEFKKAVKSWMQDVYLLKVPLKVDVNSGNNWNESH